MEIAKIEIRLFGVVVDDEEMFSYVRNTPEATARAFLDVLGRPVIKSDDIPGKTLLLFILPRDQVRMYRHLSQKFKTAVLLPFPVMADARKMRVGRWGNSE